MALPRIEAKTSNQAIRVPVIAYLRIQDALPDHYGPAPRLLARTVCPRSAHQTSPRFNLGPLYPAWRTNRQGRLELA
jgi:hypothetical protein